MKTRILSALMVVCMLVSLLPVSAFADEAGLGAFAEETADGAAALGAFAGEEVPLDSPAAPPHEHAWIPSVVAPTCTAQGYTLYTCACGESYVADYTDALNHAQTADIAEIPASCVTDGVSAGKQCLLCGQIVEGCQPIPATGHTPVEVAEVPASETAPGTAAGTRCAVCGVILSGCEAIPMLQPAAADAQPASADAQPASGDTQPAPPALNQPADQPAQNPADAAPEQSVQQAEEPADAVSDAAEGKTEQPAQPDAAAEPLTPTSEADSPDKPAEEERLKAESEEETNGADARNTVSGDCSKNDNSSAVHWEFDESSGQLSITGIGSMKDFTTSGSTRAPWYDYRDSITSVTIEAGVYNIGNSAFLNCVNLRSVTIGPNVETIGLWAFQNCSSLRTIQIPSSVTWIKGSAFMGSGLTGITIPASVAKIDTQAFYNCGSLAYVELPHSALVLGEQVFANCTSLTALPYLGGVAEIKGGTFSGCSGLTEIRVPGTVKSIGNEAFARCSGASAIVVESGVTSIGASAFKLCTGAETITVADTVTSIGSMAFQSCSGAKSIIIEGPLTSLPTSAFASCSSLEYFKIPQTVTSIAAGAFNGCTALSKVEIPTGVTMIGINAFASCSNLKTVVYPGGTREEWDAFVNSDAVKGGNDALKNVQEVVATYNPPQAPTVENTENGIVIRIPTIFGVLKFRIFRWFTTGWMPIGESVAGVFIDETAESGEEYKYCVRCLSSDGTTEMSDNSDVVSIIRMTTPTLSAPVSTASGVRLTWSRVNGASKYCVYRKGPNDSEWQTLGETEAEVLSYTDTDVVSGTEYTYSVRAGITLTGFTTWGVYAAAQTITFVSVPVISSVSGANGKITVKWNAVAGAGKYRLFRKAGSASSWSTVATTTALKYDDTNVKAGTKYTYQVRCMDSAGKSYIGAASASYTMTYTAAPALPKLSNAVGGVKITWTAVNGAEMYRVLRKTSKNGDWVRVAFTAGTSFTDKNVVSNTSYIYTVRCASADGSSYTGGYNSTGQSIKYIETPQVNTVQAVTEGIQIKWNKPAGAAKFRVFRKLGSGSWTKLADTTGTSITDKNVKGGTTYSYTVRCITSDGKTYTSGYNTTGKSLRFAATPKAPAVSLNAAGVKVSWSASSGAVNYRVYRKAAGESKWSKVTDTTALSCVDTGVKSNTKYTYAVRCLTSDGKTMTSALGAASKTIHYIAAPVISSAVNSDSGGITLSWNKPAGAEKFRLYRKGPGDTSWVQVAYTGKTSFTDNNVEPGVAYRYAVRCVSSDGKTNRSALGPNVTCTAM